MAAFMLAGPSHMKVSNSTTLKASMVRTKAPVKSTSAMACATAATTIAAALPKATSSTRTVLVNAILQPTIDPLQSPSYLIGPLRTLRASLESPASDDFVTAITDTDIGEAYALLSERLETCASALAVDVDIEGDSTMASATFGPALDAARANLPPNTLCAVLRRDVGRALAPGPTLASASTFVSSLGEGASIGHPPRLSAIERVKAYNNARVCRAALRFLSTVVRLPVLQQALLKRTSNDTLFFLCRTSSDVFPLSLLLVMQCTNSPSW